MRSDQHALRASPASIRRRGPQGTDPIAVVVEARKHTVRAVQLLADILDGKIMHDDGKGNLTATPIAMRLKAAELILERGYGKAPQAVLVKDESSVANGVHGLPILDRIKGLIAARENQGSTVDLEASELQEADVTEENHQSTEIVLDNSGPKSFHVPSSGETITVTPMSIPKTINRNIEPEDII